MRSTIYHLDIVSFIVEGARADSSRSLHLLRAIEDTVASNEVMANTFDSIAKNAGEVAEKICHMDPAARRTLDSDEGAIQRSFDVALDAMSELCQALVRRRQAALEDKLLHDSDGVVESFDKAIGSVNDAFNHLHDLKWVVMENDADVAAVVAGEPYTDVEAFLLSLGK